MHNPFSLKGKVILITGASSGIGKQCAISCSKMGAKIILVARNEERLKSVISELEGDNNLYFSLDITDYNKIEAIIKESVNKLGKVDGFIHSAGIELTKPLRVMKSTDYESVFSVNVIAGFEFAKILTKKKYSNEGSSLVFISSIMGKFGQSGKSAYCSSKAALIGGMKALALEFSQKKVRFNCVLPAVVSTDMSKELFNNLSKQEQDDIINMHPLGLGDSEDIANACIYLLSRASRWVTGTSLIVDGGYSAM